MKRLGYILLVVALICTTLSVPCLAAGKDFTDVPANEWYYNDVQNAVEKGLINGKTANTYAPEDNLTYAEAVKLAASMYKLSTEGNVDFESSSPWYMTFVEYAKANNIISKDYDWEKKATRAEYLDIFSKALPSNKLDEVNSVPDNAIPDVPMTHPSAHSIYKMYRAGIVQGSDAQYSCKPAENIKRSEVAAILTRMMDTNARRNFTITIPEYRTLYNTGYAPYDAKINEYYQGMDADDNAFDMGDWSSINNLMVHYARGSYGELGKLYYSLYDIDKNGVLELIFSEGTHFIDVYTLNNGNLVKIFEDCFFGERSRLHILSDGTLLTEGSSGASTSSCETFKLNGNGSLTNTGSYYYNTDGPDAYMKGYTYISTNEYVDKVSNYISYSVFNSLDWKLFADMNEIVQKRCYNSATISMKNGDYLYAANQFTKAGNYKDASTMAIECYYQYGKKQMDLNYVTEGIKYLSMCRGYKDTDEIIKAYYYKIGIKAYENYLYSLANRTFAVGTNHTTYTDAKEKLMLCEGYKDSSNLLLAIDKLNEFETYLSKLSSNQYGSFKFDDMVVNIKGNTLSLELPNFTTDVGVTCAMTLNYNMKNETFTATLNNMYGGESITSRKNTKMIEFLIVLFTELENMDDFINVYTDRESDSWQNLGKQATFSHFYGGYYINIDVSLSNSRLLWEISANKSNTYARTTTSAKANTSTRTNTSTKTNITTKMDTSENTTAQKPVKENTTETTNTVEIPKAETQEYDYERVCNYCTHNEGIVKMTLKNGIETDVKWKCSSCGKENWNYITLNW